MLLAWVLGMVPWSMPCACVMLYILSSTKIWWCTRVICCAWHDALTLMLCTISLHVFLTGTLIHGSCIVIKDRRRRHRNVGFVCFWHKLLVMVPWSVPCAYVILYILSSTKVWWWTRVPCALHDASNISIVVNWQPNAQSVLHRVFFGIRDVPCLCVWVPCGRHSMWHTF